VAWIEKRRTGHLVQWREPDGTKRSEMRPDRRSARELKAEVEGRLLRGDYVSKDDRDQPFIAYLAGVYEADLTIRSVTRRKYDGVIQTHLAPLFGTTAVGALTPNKVRRVFATLSSTTSAWTTFEAYKVTRRAVRQALSEGLLQRDPMTGVKIEAPRRKPVRILTADEVGTLADAVQPRFRCMVLLAAWGGLRIGEIGALEPADLDGDVVTISKAVSTPKGDPEIGPPKSSASRRRVTLPGWVAHEVRQHLLEHGGFTLENGDRVHHNNFSGHWRRACKSAGIEARFHDLRHTAVALLIQQGAHPKLIQSRMGHSSITMTMDVYGGLFPTADADLAASLEQFAPSTEERKVVPLR